MEIDNVYLTKCGEDDSYQSYFAEFEFAGDVIENVRKWDEFFKEYDHYRFKLTIEPIQKDWLI